MVETIYRLLEKLILFYKLHTFRRIATNRGMLEMIVAVVNFSFVCPLW